VATVGPKEEGHGCGCGLQVWVCGLVVANSKDLARATLIGDRDEGPRQRRSGLWLKQQQQQYKG
jgi:hypothetical protein